MYTYVGVEYYLRVGSLTVKLNSQLGPGLYDPSIQKARTGHVATYLHGLLPHTTWWQAAQLCELRNFRAMTSSGVINKSS